MASNVFVYGTLIVPEVMELVSGRAHVHATGRLEGYARFLLVDRVYPGIVPATNASTPGRVYFDVDDEGLARLDWYEADEYDRDEIVVEIAGGRRIEAWTYVIAPEHHGIVSRDPWDEARFRAEHLQRFLEHVREDMRAFAEESF